MALTDISHPTDIAMLTDLYELTMAQGLWESGKANEQGCFTAFYRDHPFGSAYAVMCGTAELPELVENLRYTIHDDSVFLLDKRTPSFTELKKGSEQFQIITCPCEGSLEEFCRAAKEKSEAQTSFLETSSKTDDLIYISCLPWFDLTCCTNERQVDIDDAIPRITWGKYIRQENGRETLGLSIEVNHRLVDGVHLGRFYESLQNKINELE